MKFQGPPDNPDDILGFFLVRASFTVIDPYAPIQVHHGLGTTQVITSIGQITHKRDRWWQRKKKHYEMIIPPMTFYRPDHIEVIGLPKGDYWATFMV